MCLPCFPGAYYFESNLNRKTYWFAELVCEKVPDQKLQNTICGIVE